MCRRASTERSRGRVRERHPIAIAELSFTGGEDEVPVLKSVGYLISTISVILLGIVSWQATASEPDLRIALIAGMFASVLGMACRWLAYVTEKKLPAGMAASPGDALTVGTAREVR